MKNNAWFKVITVPDTQTGEDAIVVGDRLRYSAEDSTMYVKRLDQWRYLDEIIGVEVEYDKDNIRKKIEKLRRRLDASERWII